MCIRDSFKNVADGGRTPAVHIFESLILVHSLAVLGKVSGRNEDFFFFQLAGDLIRTVALNRHGKDALDHLSLIHISEPTRLGMISYAVFCLKKKMKKKKKKF